MTHFNYQAILGDIVAEIGGDADGGAVATYIPELAEVDPAKLGVHLVTVGGEHFAVGDSDERFSTQSVSKVLLLTLALRVAGEAVWQRVGVEPSGSPFNSLVQLEYEKGIPRNPMINAGAIVVCDVLLEVLDDPRRELRDFVRRLAGVDNIDFNARVADSERRTGFGNYAVANLMKAFGNLRHDVKDVLELYFSLCSIEMSCRELAQAFRFLASEGADAGGGEAIVAPRRAKRINAIMQMCGFYDEAGEFAFRVGLPGKSGVGGGIVAVHPGRFSVAVWSPRLNAKGNSFRGMRLLEALTTRTALSIF